MFSKMIKLKTNYKFLSVVNIWLENFQFFLYSMQWRWIYIYFYNKIVLYSIAWITLFPLTNTYEYYISISASVEKNLAPVIENSWRPVDNYNNQTTKPKPTKHNYTQTNLDNLDKLSSNHLSHSGAQKR